MTLVNIRQFLLFGLLTGYLLLNYSFMLIRVPPTGFGIPLGELFLFFALLTINVPRVLQKIGASAYLLPFFVWWGLGFGRMVVDSIDHGFWAFRDATSLIESLYIIVGFAIAGNAKFMDRLVRWLPWVLAAGCVYAMGFPFTEQIQALSPSIPGASLSLPIPIFGTFNTSVTLLLWSAFYLLCVSRGESSFRLVQILLACGLIAFAVVVVQARTTYFQLLGMAFICLLFRRKALASMSLAVPLLVVVVAAIMALDLRVSGRLTDKISFSFFLDHFTAIFGETSYGAGNVNAAAEGVDLRFGWWLDLYRRLTDNAVYLLTGLGYGIPLTNFYSDTATLVREPHNSYISVVSRLGLIGFVAWFWMMVEIIKVWFRAYRDAQRLRWRGGENLLLLILVFAVLIFLSGLGEDALEKPYHAIPLYCLWGVALRIGYMLRRRNLVEPAPPIPVVTPWAPRPAFANWIHRPEHSL